MKCGGCVRTVEKILLDQPSVQKASVNLVTKTACLDLKDGKGSQVDQVLIALNNRGFIAKNRTNSFSDQKTASELIAQKNFWNQWKQLIIALSLLILSGLGHLAENGQIDIQLLGTLPFHATLATVALLGPGFAIIKAGFKSAIAFAPSMDTLVGLGVCSAYFASLIALIWPQVSWPCFFNEPVMLLGFVLLGRFLEERARFKTGKALQELIQLQPETARLFISDNEVKEVRVGALKPGEKLQLLAGDRVPVDGIVLEGNSAIDVSSLTGEPLPINASKGTELSSGTLNLESTLIIEVKKIGAETALARIVGLVEEAQARKAPIQRLADRVAGRFCYGVTALALATFFFWWQLGTKIWPEVINTPNPILMHHQHGLHMSLGAEAQTPLGLALQLSIAVLVIACPCALGLATPTVITVASGQAAKQGWLFRGGDVLEIASNIKQIVFDKTGTLTIGRPLVVDYSNANDPDKLFQIAASLEKNSRHPIAHAILQEAENRELKLLKTSNVITYPGKGIKGKVQNNESSFLIGTPEWIQSEGIKFDSKIILDLEKRNIQHQSIIGVADSQKLLGIIHIDDKLRKDVDIALSRLRKQNLSLSIFSGDRKNAVKYLGNKLGFNNNQLGWQLLPNQKQNRLKELQKEGAVAMVGDGINDAPALAASDLGIAIGTGTQIAQESADLILLGDKLESLPDAILLSKRAMKKIQQNLIWAFGYNIIALPIAAGLLLPNFGLLLSPPIASLLMALSSISVVLNALSLKIK